jgi:structural maintenance of chromosomes protein 5
MSSPAIPLRRRPRSEFEASQDQGDSDENGRPGSSDSSLSKRARTREDALSSPSESPEPPFPGEHRRRPPGARADATNGDQIVSSRAFHTTKDHYQPGAIVRIKVTNFVTYEKASFHPGPNLNMVIGPNGTGKSSLVCAICLGLGYSPVHLGRAQKVGEFVKHGSDHATIEIELQARREDEQNHIVKVRIIRDGDKRKWWINNNETSLKTVQALTRELGIQVDNLCQFLPQDRVAEFAGLNPVELLHHTQRAAAPEQMLGWHDQLKSLRKEQKSLQFQHETDQEALANQQERQENLRADVERLKERAEIQERIALLKKTVPFVEYTSARKHFLGHKERRQDAQKRLKELEKNVEPTLRAVNAKQQYQSLIEVVVNDRKRDLEDAERAAEGALRKIEEVQSSITEVIQERKAEKEGDRKRKQDQQRIQAKIKDLESQLQHPPPPFDSEDWNSRIVSYPILSLGIRS